MSETAIVAFAKDPDNVQVKTRLSSFFNRPQRNRIYEALLNGCLKQLSGLVDCKLYLACFPSSRSAFFTNLEMLYGFNLLDQKGKDLGERLENCFSELLETHKRVIIFGTDVALLPLQEISTCIESDTNRDILIGPSLDGGYFAIGKNSDINCSIFENVIWGSENVLAQTRENCSKNNLKIHYLKTVRDIDTDHDLKALKKELLEQQNSNQQSDELEIKQVLLELKNFPM